MPRRSSAREMYNRAVRWIAANAHGAQQETHAEMLVADIFDIAFGAVARHVWLVKNNRVTEQRTFPLPKAATPSQPRKPRWIG